jgi:hypothetical protein
MGFDGFLLVSCYGESKDRMYKAIDYSLEHLDKEK